MSRGRRSVAAAVSRAETCEGLRMPGGPLAETHEGGAFVILYGGVAGAVIGDFGSLLFGERIGIRTLHEIGEPADGGTIGQSLAI